LLAVLAVLAGAFPAAASAATNPGAFWHLDEATGTVAADSSGNANHGTIDGAARIGGRFRNALRFDGVDDKVLIARSATLEPSAVTVEGWVRSPASPGAFRHIVAQGAVTCQAASYGLYSGADGGLAFYVSSDNGSVFTVSPAAPASVWDGAWHHVAGTYDGVAVRLYVDGIQVGTGSSTTLPIGYGLPNPAGLLGSFGGTCNPQLAYSGDLDEARVWPRALSAQEIAASVAQGDASTTALDQIVDSAQAVTFSSRFSDGDAVISTESSTGNENITSVKIVGLVPLISQATCRDGLLSLLRSWCRFTLSNGGRTAAVKVRPLLLKPIVTLRVGLSSGLTFDVYVDTSGS
jgi:concanavalin A-like lectin/glucanase superfamily protein